MQKGIEMEKDALIFMIGTLKGKLDLIFADLYEFSGEIQIEDFQKVRLQKILENLEMVSDEINLVPGLETNHCS